MNTANQIAGSLTLSAPSAPSAPIMNTTGAAVNGSVANGNTTANPFASTMLSSVVPIDRELFTGSVGDPNNRTSHIVGGHDDPSPFPFKNPEHFTGSVGDPNNRTSHIVGGHDDPLAYPYTDGRIL